jgi:hypothetical protein
MCPPVSPAFVSQCLRATVCMLTGILMPAVAATVMVVAKPIVSA